MPVPRLRKPAGDPPRKRKKPERQGPNQMFVGWITSKPLVASIQSQFGMVRFYLVRSGALMHECPRCKEWYEPTQKGYTFETGPKGLSISCVLECPACSIQYRIEHGVFILVHNPVEGGKEE